MQISYSFVAFTFIMLYCIVTLFFRLLLCYAAVAQQGAQCIGIVGSYRIAVFVERLYQQVKFTEQILLVLEEEFGPHILVEARHAGKIAETAGTVPTVSLCRGAFNECIGDNVTHLRVVGNHAVVEVGCGHHELLEAKWRKHLFHAVKQGDVIVYRRYHDERCSVEECPLRVFVARVLQAGHRVSAYEREAVLSGKRKAKSAHVAFCSAKVNHKRFGVDEPGIVTQITGNSHRGCSEQQQVATANGR